MKTLPIVVLLLAGVPRPAGFAQDSGTAGGAKAGQSAEASEAGGCATCAAGTASSGAGQAVALKPIPGTKEMMLVGSIENLIPIGVLTVLGCKQCSAEAVHWALQQGSSFDDVERALRTVAAMQKLECFGEQFGPEVRSRMKEPLAAAEEALRQARTRAAGTSLVPPQ